MHEHTTIPFPHQQLLTKAPLTEVVRQGDGKPYSNTYAWFLDRRDDKVVKAFAFFNSVVFNEFWQRVKP